MIKLPKTIQPATSIGLRKLLLFGHAKLGKTELLSKLPNCLLIDLESGSHAYPGMTINVKKIAQETGKSVLEVLREVAVSIEEENKKNGSPIYDFIAIDTLTALEDYAVELATIMYKTTTIGKNYKGSNVVTDLDKGLGYSFLREAFKKIYTSFEMLPKECLILVGHVKNSSVLKEGKDLSARDLNLVGKNKILVAQDVDAIGYMYREQNSKVNYISFETSETDLATGSRAKHLSNRKIKISEMGEDNNLVTYWEEIFPYLKK